MARHRVCGALMLMLADAFTQPPRTTLKIATLKPHAIDARRVRRVSLTAAPNSNEIDVQRTLATLIAAQVVLFVGVDSLAVSRQRRQAGENDINKDGGGLNLTPSFFL